MVFLIQIQKDIGSNIGLVEYGMRLKIEAECGIREILKAGEMEEARPGYAPFEGGTGDKTGAVGIIF